MARKFLTPIDLSGLELQNAVVQNLPTGSLPGAPADGRIAYDSTTDELKVAINGTWTPLTTGASGIAAVNNLDWKTSVRVVAVTNGALATAYANGQTVDGVVLATGDRILLVAQTTTSENGIYTVNAAGAPTRSADAASSTQLTVGTRVWVEQGTVNQYTTWTYFSGAFTAQLWTIAYQLGPTTSVGFNSSTGNITLSTSGGAVSIQSGNIGLNGRSPTASVDLASSTATTGGIGFGGGEFYLYRSAGNTLKLNASSGLDMSSAKITGLLDPTGAQDAATKNYVDQAIQGLDPKASVVVATTGAETFTISAGAVTQIAGTTIDGQTPAINDRILIKDAPAVTGGGSANSNQPGNGIYVVTSNTTNLSVSRATDMNAWTEVPGAYAWVEKGTTNADTAFLSTADQGGVLNTTAIKFVKFGTTTSSQYYSTLGTGSGTTISIPQSTHQLRQSRGVIVQVQDESTGNIVDADVSVASTGDVTVTFATSQTLTGFRVTLTG